ncbi:hypothetical protein RHGRI_023109 [Rhododendron griersonianum]|uniref:tRNA (guanine(26)-N(2))-dimethyltransferase n=1 Tax=Rhododendron griersonianum TaxID=479676 RepID=A0AAV6J6F1_9ERIC|nr:hypothetical protein RHGRI_023109 [Rhododendron griersonianum]
MGDDNGKTREEEKQQENKATPSDISDYKIIKEGEAEILMIAKNEVFYNKAQVNNRDISIAVLRTFISKRKEEHETMLSRRTKAVQKVSNDSASKLEAPIESNKGNDKSNGECEESEEASLDEPCSIPEEPVKILEGKGRGELKPPRVLEALSASGLRALRYAREIEGIGQVVALDNDKDASCFTTELFYKWNMLASFAASVEACRRNIKFNGSVACAKVESHLADARVYMLTHPKEFDVVDLDPYGSPSAFLDSAVQSVADGGMLLCTATDMAVLCGGNGEVCYSKYGSYPLRGKYCHEMALRILLACIEAQEIPLSAYLDIVCCRLSEGDKLNSGSLCLLWQVPGHICQSHANRYKRYIVPVLSVQMDFYVRVFVRIYTSASAMKNTPLKLSYVYQCTGCDSFHLQPLGRTVSKNNSVRYLPGFGPVVSQECSDCGKKYNMGGPIWSAPIHDQEWVTSMLADVKSMKDRYPAYDRISAVLTTVSEELLDVPLFLSLHNLCSTLKCTSPSAVIFRSAVINAGFRISGTHVNPLGLKSDAPMDVIWDIMRCWANFARAVASLSKAQAKKVARFLPNPERHWGPKLRAGRQITSKHVSLLGPQALNGMNNHKAEEEQQEEGNEPQAKRKKTEDPNSLS